MWAREEKSKRENPLRKLVARLRREKWAWREIGKRKKPRRGRRKREASEKTHFGSLSLGCGEKSGRGEKLASGKTHGVGEEGAYVRSTYLGCARRYTTERKRCGDTREREKQAGKTVGRETGMPIMLLVYL